MTKRHKICVFKIKAVDNRVVCARAYNALVFVADGQGSGVVARLEIGVGVQPVKTVYVFLACGQGSSVDCLLYNVAVIDRLRRNAGFIHVVDHFEIFPERIACRNKDVILFGRVFLVLKTPVLNHIFCFERDDYVIFYGFDIIRNNKNLVNGTDKRQLIVRILGDYLIDKLICGNRGKMHLIQDDQQRHFFGNIVEYTD